MERGGRKLKEQTNIAMGKAPVVDGIKAKMLKCGRSNSG